VETKRQALVRTYLFGSGFVADGWLDVRRLGTGMTLAADQDSEAGFLEHGAVVVVGVLHRPAAPVLSGLDAARPTVCSQTVAIRQHLKRVVLVRLQLTDATHLHKILNVAYYTAKLVTQKIATYRQG